MAGKTKKATSINYDASQIKILGGIEAVRMRPSMYIGSTGKAGLHHLIYEVVDNSVDEALAGHCDLVEVTIHKGNSVTVADNGRGIPFDIHPQTKRPAAEVVLTTLHAGGKFGDTIYKVAGGLHGVGVSVVNALSEWMEAEVYRQGECYKQKYERGKPQKEKISAVGEKEKTGTVISFRPDEKVFDDIIFDYETIKHRLQEVAFLTKGLKIKFTDERKEKSETYKYEGGVLEFVEYLNKGKTPLYSPPPYFSAEKEHLFVEVALQHCKDYYDENIFSYVNCIRTREGGTHLIGLKSALTRAINNYAQKNKLAKEAEVFDGEDAREGLTVVLNLRIPNPQFEGQTKTKLGNSEAKGLVDSIVMDGLSAYLEKNPAVGRAIAEKALLAYRVRVAARKAQELERKKSALETATLPGKLADCTESDPAKCELFLVEGDSAGGCFWGGTEVALVDGRSLSFKNLAKEWEQGKVNYCYTIKPDQSIDIEKILNPRKTRKEAPVIKIVLDNDNEIVCTPDHKFMLRDGSYVEAKNLKPHMSLMPLRKKLSEIKGRITIKGYEMVLNPKTHKWVFTHLLADQHNLENGKYSEKDGSHKHHLDFNKLNNNPENITRMPPQAHLGYHRGMLGLTLKQWTDEFRRKRKKAYSHTYLDHSLSFLKQVLEQRGELFYYDWDRKGLTPKDTNLLSLKTLKERFFEGDEEKLIEAAQNYNHKTKKIEYLEEKIDVYDLEVPNTHNFALASGIFVHNSAKQGRDRRFQAILPLKGKILNVEKARLDKILANDEIRTLITAIGPEVVTGLRGDGRKGKEEELTPQQLLESLRYHRVVLLCDADVDGAHIRTLLLTFFYRYAKDLIENGNLYIAQPPLYRVAKGKAHYYVYSDKELERTLKEIGKEGATLQRYKGLGEMNPEQLWETTLNPETRTMLQVTLEDAEVADEIFKVLMGTEVEPRREFIEAHAKEVKRLDV